MPTRNERYAELVDNDNNGKIDPASDPVFQSKTFTRMMAESLSGRKE